jgi:predicted deacylase
MFVVHAGQPGPGKANVMIAAGIHGDEPAGVEAALRFLETDARDHALLSRFSFVVFPCNNPTGWERNTRENRRGIDLNRQFLARHPEPEVALIMRALEGRCFDLVFEMHEDVDSPGLYLYEIAENSDDHVGEAIVAAARASGCPINMSPVIEGLPADAGIIRRRMNLKRFRKTRLPQAIYAFRTCGGHVITLEPPASVLPMETRVQIELASLSIALSRTKPGDQSRKHEMQKAPKGT